MYLQHWSLKSPPLENLPDSRFFFPTEEHDRALATLSYAVHETAEPVTLAGAPGCGKTLLLRALRRSLPREKYRVAFVPNVACSQVGLLRRVAYHLGGDSRSDGPHSPSNVAQAMTEILGKLAESESAAQTVVLMLDDWPAESPAAMLDQLRWLLDLDLERSRLCVLIAGERLDVSAWPAALAQRISASLFVGPLRRDALSHYLDHRMTVAAGHSADALTKGPGGQEAEGCRPPAPSHLRPAGPSDPPRHGVFSPEAVAAIADWSGCVPRLVNRAAHLALRVAYVDLATRVDADAVARAIGQLGDHASPAGRRAVGGLVTMDVCNGSPTESIA